MAFNITDALDIISKVVTTFNQVEPAAAQLITDIKPFATALYEQLTGKTISDAELVALEAQVDALYVKIQTPLPPDDGSTTT